MNIANAEQYNEDDSLENLVSASQAGLRLDAFLAKQVSAQYVSREKCKNLILEGQCRIDGLIVRSPSRRLREGEHVQYLLPADTTPIVPEQGTLHVYHEDAHILVLYKPAGLTMHPCPSCPQNTFLQRVLFHYPDVGHLGGLRPGIVHRLDKDTSGLVIVARSQEAYLALSAAFAERHIKKTYLALVYGVPPDTGECHKPVGRDSKSKVRMAVTEKGREAHTFWKVLWKDSKERYALLEVCISTGRTHQIRVHLAHCGFPLVGDALYGIHHVFQTPSYVLRLAEAFMERYPQERIAGNDVRAEDSASMKDMPACDPVNTISVKPFENDLTVCSMEAGKNVGANFTETQVKPSSGLTVTRQMLHAWRLGFVHPVTEEMLHFSSSLPEDMATFFLSTLLAPKCYILTGLPASGKSTALQFFAALGMPVWSADVCVRALCQPGQMGWLALRGQFGDRFFYDPLLSSSSAYGKSEDACFAHKPPSDLSGQAQSIMTEEGESILRIMPSVSDTCEVSLERSLGQGISSEAWHLDRYALATAMMQDHTIKDIVEALLHPLVLGACVTFFASKEVEAFGMGMAEIPLWFEQRRFDHKMPPVEIIGVAAADSVRHARLSKTRGWSQERIHAFDAMHYTQTEKMKACDRVISNEGDEAVFIKCLEENYAEMLEDAQIHYEATFLKVQKSFTSVLE